MANKLILSSVLAAAVGIGSNAIAADITPYPPMMVGDTPATSNGWSVTPVFTVGETIRDYQPVGILDGIGAFNNNNKSVRVLVNHELRAYQGYAYKLANGTELTGARVSYFDINATNLKVKEAGLAYDTVYDRAGNMVTDPAQINETGNNIDGFARFCSARSVFAGEYGFVDDIFLTGEETSNGTEWVIDVNKKDIWAIPAMGRAAWENVSPLETGYNDKVALLGGDDTAGAPLYLYVGTKNAKGDGSFLDGNGLAEGQLYCWAADNGDLTPDQFNGMNVSRTGFFIPLAIQDPAMAGNPGYDSEGYLDGDTLRDLADSEGCFSFSRPEDLHENPKQPNVAVFASTGRGKLYPSDDWGTLYIVDVDFSNLSNITAELTILHDADDLPVPDQGIRSPDNLTWADDGFIYVQEDRSTGGFGAVTEVEASAWKVSPASGDYVRIGEIDRSAVAPAGSTDGDPNDLGDWETSGVLDVTKLFKTEEDETLLIGTVQAHSIRDGVIADNILEQGGQLIFLSNHRDTKHDEDDDMYEH